jgi:SAM-dependent methyltransferase
MNPEFWNSRFNEAEWAYGTKANDFVRSCFHHPGQGRVLCLAEGQGRNAVYLASLGYQVTALDYSEVGLERAQALAKSQGLSIETLQANLAEYSFETDTWDGIVSIFGHLPSALRSKVNAQLFSSLKPGGFLCVEGYHQDQLNFQTGGPAHPDLLYSEDVLTQELCGQWSDFIVQKSQRIIKEGPYHNGPSSTVQIWAVR